MKVRLDRTPVVRTVHEPKATVQAKPLIKADKFDLHNTRNTAETSGVRSPMSTVDDAFKKAHGSLSSIGTELNVAGTELDSAPVKQLGEDTHQLSRSDLGAHGFRDAMHGLYDRAKHLLGIAKTKADEGNAVVKRGAQRLETQTSALLTTAKTFTSDITHATDLHQNIDALGVGDSYVLMGHGYVAAGVKVAAGATLSVARSEQGFSVDAGAEMAAGWMPCFGFSLGAASVGVSAGALAEVGGSIGFSFDTAQDAERGARALAHGALGISVSDRDFLKSHLKSVGLTGAAVLQAFASGTLGAASLTQFGIGSAAATLTVENPLGEDRTLVVHRQLQGKSITYGGPAATPGKDWLGASLAAARVTTTWATEQRYPLPKDVTLQALLQHPFESFEKTKRQQPQQHTELSLTREATVAGNGPGQLVSVSFDGDAKSMNEASAAWSKGELETALETLPSDTKLTGRLAPYRKHGVELLPEVTLGPVSAGLLAIAQRQDVDLDAAKTVSLPPQGLWHALKSMLDRATSAP